MQAEVKLQNINLHANFMKFSFITHKYTCILIKHYIELGSTPASYLEGAKFISHLRDWLS